jgi:hypothetical protein
LLTLIVGRESSNRSRWGDQSRTSWPSRDPAA